MRAEIGGLADAEVTSIYRNLIVSRAGTEIWSVYRLLSDIAGASAGPGGAGGATVVSLADHVHSDFSLLRVAWPWSVANYAMGIEATADARHVHRAALSRHLSAQRAALEGLAAHTVDLYLAVRLTDPPSAPASRELLRWCLEAEAKALASVTEVVRVRRAPCRELVGLIRHGYRRGIPAADDDVGADRLTGAGACAAEAPGPVRLKSIDELGAPVIAEDLALGIETEHGASHQSFLRVDGFSGGDGGARERAREPLGALDAVDFPVDAALNVTPATRGRRACAGTWSLCVSAPNPALLERRVVALRRALAGTPLVRPVGEQLDLFRAHLPGTRPASRGILAAGQLELLRIGGQPIGGEAGFYVGHTLTGPPRPVLLDPTESRDDGTPGAVLLSGVRRSGKTLALKLMLYHAFLVGSLVFDFSSGTDHPLERLPGVAGHVDMFELSTPARFAGLLDPLRIGPADGREQLVFDFLVGILPPPVTPEWRLQIAAAIRVVAAAGARTCSEVTAELERGGVSARAAARAIRGRAGSGIARLGFAHPEDRPPPAGRKPITSVQIPDLRAPDVGRETDPAAGGRLVSLLMRLLAAYALHVCAPQRDRHCMLGFDDATALLRDAPGREMLSRLSDRSRSSGFTPVVAAGATLEGAWLHSTFGAALRFGAEGGAPPGPGRCQMRDYRDRTAAVQIDIPDDRLLALLDRTNDLGA